MRRPEIYACGGNAGCIKFPESFWYFWDDCQKYEPSRDDCQKYEFKEGMKQRKIAVLTGTRAEYGLLKPVIKAIEAHPQLELQLMVTGMHLQEEHGMSIQQIEKDGFPIISQTPMHPPTDTGWGMAQSVSQGIRGIADELQQLQPDVLLILGDRTEVLAAAIAAIYMNIAVAHIHGGDRSKGGLDESVRHAITKMAHIHFAATPRSAERILKMGERPEHIFTVGAPGLDTILHVPLLSSDQVLDKFSMNSRSPYLLLVQHPVSTFPEESVSQIRTTLAAIAKTQFPCIIVYPNSDAGGQAIIQEIEHWVSNHPQFQAHQNLPHEVYLSAMKHCAALIGNSSSGVIESASFKVPVVNIGIRQEGRERAGNVLDVPHDVNQIYEAIQTSLGPAFQHQVAQCVSPYGEGKAGEKIADILAEIILDKSLLQKQITY